MTQTTHFGRADYDPAVDGLRAVAVILVLLFHVDAPFAPGGFIGVDVFFVISGYLITGLILRQGADFSFWEFYKRRFRRLFPALIATVLATLAVAGFILNHVEFGRLGPEAVWASLSASNIWFWLQAGYFDAQAEFKPLLHTWSLGVEEQFYLIWPLLVVFAARAGRVWLIAALTGLGLASFAAAFALQGETPAAVFFLTPFRVFQFALGGLLAVTGVAVSGGRGAALGAASLVALGLLGGLTRGDSAGVAQAMLAPALAACGVIAASRAPVMQTILGSALPVWIGRRSYSIYLVHWPLVVLWRAAGRPELGVAAAVGLFAASIALGAALNWLVEARFRWPKSARAEGRVYVGSAAALVLAVAGGAVAWTAVDNGPGIAKRDLLDRRAALIRADVCNLTPKAALESWSRDTCFTLDDDRPNWLVIGDSYGADAFVLLRRSVPEANFLQATMRSCPPFLVEELSARERRRCVEFDRFRFDELASDNRLDGVVLAGNWKPANVAALENTVAALRERGVRVLVFGQRAEFVKEIPDVLRENPSLIEMEARTGVAREVDNLRRRLSAAFQQQYLDVYEVQCPNARCPIADPKGVPLYVDQGHFSHAAGDVFADRIHEAFASRFAPSE